MNFGAESFEFDVVTKCPKMNLGAKLRCAQNDKMNLGAQCFVIDVVSKMTQNENRCEVKCILLKQLLQSSKNYKRTSVGNVSTFK